MDRFKKHVTDLLLHTEANNLSRALANIHYRITYIDSGMQQYIILSLFLRSA
jgi:hypothetical protein